MLDLSRNAFYEETKMINAFGMQNTTGYSVFTLVKSSACVLIHSQIVNEKNVILNLRGED